jgi:hypothetical protein
MVWVGNFKSLQSALDKPGPGAPLEVHTWLRSEIGLIITALPWEQLFHLTKWAPES